MTDLFNVDMKLRRMVQSLGSDEVIKFLSTLSDDDCLDLLYDWSIWARDKQLPPPLEDWQTWLILAGRGWGKMLCMDTKISTPTGWKRLGDIHVGDQVFDEHGVPCNVTKVFDGTPETCYRVSFSDGAWVDSCSEHLWVTWNQNERHKDNLPDGQYPQDWADKIPRTTQEIKDTVHRVRKSDGSVRNNHAIPLAKPLKYPSAQLPIPSYIVGYALMQEIEIDSGLRPNRSDYLLCEPGDKDELLSYFGIHGFDAGLPNARCGFRLARWWRQLEPLVKDRIIPEKYLRAGPQQRLELLRGMMDAEGRIHNPKSKADRRVCLEVPDWDSRPVLVEQILELVRSLGDDPYLVTQDVYYGGSGNPSDGVRHRVRWVPTQNPFRLKRKAEPVRTGHPDIRSCHRLISNVELIDSKPMRCLTVDSPHSMYLVSEWLIPTHNTRTGTEAINRLAESQPECRIALVGPTSADVRDVMLQGDSGLITIAHPARKPHYEPSKRRVVWPNGSQAFLYSAEEPERLRGPQHHHCLCDEPASWRFPETMDMLMFGLRLGTDPKRIITGTPKPTPFIKKLVEDPTVCLTIGSTYENRDNLAPTFFKQIVSEYEGTRLGQQELHAKILDDNPNALWQPENIEPYRLSKEQIPQLDRVVVALDPSGSSSNSADECGIMVGGIGPDILGQFDKRSYIFEDATLRGSPDEWGRKAVELYKFYKADRIVAERNFGGDMVEHVIRTVDPNVSFKDVHASRGKLVRAEPVAALYEQGRVSHIGVLSKLEEELYNYDHTTRKSPNRLDGLVWLLTELVLNSRAYVHDFKIFSPTGKSSFRNVT